MIRPLIVTLLGLACAFGGGLKYSGVNEAGLEFGGVSCSPQASSVSQFASEGHNLFRIPFAWEKLQKCFNCNLDSNYLNLIKQAVSLVTSRGDIALLDLHNYFRYNGNLVTDSSAFGNVWSRLAQSIGNSSNVWFGLMNEPHDMSTEAVLALHQAAVTAIRATGNKNKLIVSGNGWDSLSDWTGNWYGTSNTLLAQLQDPAANHAFEMHIYFDSDNSGTHAECTKFDRSKAQSTTNWLRSSGRTALVTEFGLAANANCVDNYGKPFLQFLKDNSDVWMGYTYWAAGSCWPSDYLFTVDPANGIAPSDPRRQLLQQYSSSAKQ